MIGKIACFVYKLTGNSLYVGVSSIAENGNTFFNVFLSY